MVDDLLSINLLSFKLLNSTHVSGSNAAVNPVKNQIAVENYPGELTIYNPGSGDHESKLLFSGRVAFVRFSLDGKILFVLTDQQMAHAFDVERIARIEPAISSASSP